MYDTASQSSLGNVDWALCSDITMLYSITSSAGGHHNMPHPCKLTFDLESGVRFMCDVAYLCANFSLPRPLCS